ncbi:MAG: enoyl-CoA hydratase [Candidatus Sericytochromatia bacterium]|nr:enoyl-CoA hydratase [Candidatus Sericytochromatia bacterium]
MEIKNFETIEFTLVNRVATITLNRPQAMNALNDVITSELVTAFEMCKSDEVKVVVLTGNGKSFCSGGDIKLMTQLETKPNAVNDLLLNLHGLVIEMKNLDKPIVAKVNGFAFGAGFSLALACDLRVGSKSSSYSCAFVNIGLVPDTGASFFLTKLLGSTKAAELMFLGKTIKAQEAYNLGLLNNIVEDEELDDTVEKLVTELLSKPSGSLSRIKQLINRAIISDLSDQLGLEAMFQREVTKTSDFREGITAFIQKRTANFI